MILSKPDIKLETKLVGFVEGKFYIPSFQRGYRWGKMSRNKHKYACSSVDRAVSIPEPSAVVRFHFQAYQKINFYINQKLYFNMQNGTVF